MGWRLLGPAARAARAVMTEESEHTAGRDGTGVDVPSRPRAHYSFCHPLAPLTGAAPAHRRPAGAAPSRHALASLALGLAPASCLSVARDAGPGSHIFGLCFIFFRKRILISRVFGVLADLFDLSIGSSFYIHGTVRFDD